MKAYGLFGVSGFSTSPRKSVSSVAYGCIPTANVWLYDRASYQPAGVECPVDPSNELPIRDNVGMFDDGPYGAFANLNNIYDTTAPREYSETVWSKRHYPVL